MDEAPSPLENDPLALPIAALVLGIVGLCLSPFLIGGVLGFTASILAFVHLRSRTRRRGMALWGALLGLLAILGSALTGVFIVGLYRRAPHRDHARKDDDVQ